MKLNILFFSAILLTLNLSAQELQLEYSQTFSNIENQELKTIVDSWFLRKDIKKDEFNEDSYQIDIRHKLSDISNVSNQYNAPTVSTASSSFSVMINVSNQQVNVLFSNPYLNADSLVIDRTEIEAESKKFSDNLFDYVRKNESLDAAQDYNIQQLSKNLSHTKKYLVKSGNKGLASIAIGLIGTLAGTTIMALPQIIDVNNSKALTGTGIAISSLSGIASFSFGISSYKNKKRAGEDIEF